jgi:hypothetical protein
LAWGGCGLDSTGSGQGPLAGCCVCGDKPSGSCATELVSYIYDIYICTLTSHIRLNRIPINPIQY